VIDGSVSVVLILLRKDVRMKKYMMFAAFVALCGGAYAAEEQSVLVANPVPVSAPMVVESAPMISSAPVCSNGKCCMNGKCFLQPRFERNVAVSTTCDSCGVKETTRTVSRTRRRR
jgi:hypothetical protein